MSGKEHDDKGEPILLDGSPLCPRQNLEGRHWTQDITDAYRFSLLDKYITLDEWIYREFPPKCITMSDRANWSIRLEAIDDKIDHYDYFKRCEDRLNKQRELAREARALSRAQLNRYELGAREFTFTYSPKWFDDAEARLQMASAIQKLCKYYKEEIIQMRAVGEVGSSGLSHIHCFYKLKNGKKITDKNFQRAYKMWDTKKKTGPLGHQGGHHQTVKNESDFSGYIDKDIENSWFEVNIDTTLNPQ